jgi:hypothetical protein
MKRFSLFAAVLVPLAACSQPDEGATADAQRGGPSEHLGYYAAKARSDEYPTPDTGDVGVFRVERGCLIFVSERGERYLPVFPIDTRFEAIVPGDPFAILTGQEIHVERPYTVKGGAGEYGLDPPSPPECPDEHFLVGGLL